MAGNVKNIYINSNPNFIDVGGIDSNFTITKPYSNFNKTPRKIKLLSARIPFTWNNITSINNNFNLIEYPTTVITTSIQVPASQYTGTTLASELQTLLNANTKKSYNYVVSYSTTLFKFTISSTNGSFELDFTVANSIGIALGFGDVLLSPANNTFTSTGVAVIQPDTEIFITSNLVSGIDNGIVPWFSETVGSTYPNYNILATIPISSCYGGIINYQSSDSEPWQIASQSNFALASINSGTSNVIMQFGLLLLSGTAVQLNGAHWTANILLSF